MKVLEKDKAIHVFTAGIPFTCHVHDGEIFKLVTDDCYGGRFQSENDLRGSKIDASFDAAVGPVEILGAEPGDALCVEILEIALDDHGVMTMTRGLGVLGDTITSPDTRIISIADGCAIFSPSIRIPLHPMIGVIGVLPDHGKFPCTIPGDFGGNMDTREITTGTKVYLPVFVRGAGLAIADLHACMGDGELCGTGLETAGSVILSVSVIKNKKLFHPVLDTGDCLYIICTAQTFEEAVRKCTESAVSLLQDKCDLSYADAYRLASIACSIRISQVVNSVITLKIQIPKYLWRRGKGEEHGKDH